MYFFKGDIFLKQNKNVDNCSPIIKIIKSISISAFIGILISISILAISSIIFLKSGNFPIYIINTLTILIISFSTIISGYISARMLCANGMFFGILTGFVIFIIIFISGLMCYSGEITSIILIKLIALLSSGAIGGIIGVNKKIRIK